jgi:hypothetical protein
MKPEPIDTALYERVKREADRVYSTPSAYKSGYIVRLYKELGGRYRGERTRGALARWFAEEWTDVNPDKTATTYPVYRPTKRITKDTPLTAREVSADDLRKKAALKQKIGSQRLPPFQKK